MSARKHWVLLFMTAFILFTASGFIFGQPDLKKDEQGFIRKYKLANDQFKKCTKYLLKENYSKAEKGLRKCLEIMPQHVNSHYYLCQLLYRKGELEAALSHIQQAKTHYQSVARMIVSIQKLNSHKIREQRKILRETLDSYQGYEANDGACNVKPILNEARDKMTSLDGKEASARQLALLEQVPAEYFYTHGNILFKLGRYREAHDQYLEAIKTNPGHGKAYNNLANLYYMAKKYKQSLYYLNLAEEKGIPINHRLKQAVVKAVGTMEE
jgi:tetratricopeptide (TPR) repeat protein